MRNSKVQFIVHAAMIAAIYVVLTYFISAFNLASGAIQVRISEALTILPYFTPAAIPGLFVGCLLANLLTGAAIYDVSYGYGLTMEYGGRDWSIPFYMLTVGAGEIICCCVLGTILLNALAKVRNVIFKKED
mgnify:CR=1 FL=1